MNNLNEKVEIAQKMTTNLIKSFFSSSNKVGVLISEPTFKITNNRIIVQVFYYLSPQLSNLSNIQKNSLSIAISQLYPKTIIIELQLVQQYQPYINASILAQYLTINGSKYGFHRMITILLSNVPYYNPNTIITENNIITYCITGLKIQLSGLLTTQRNRARKTVYTASAGTFHSNTLIKTQLINNQKINIEYGQSTSKSFSGAFTVKV